MTTTPPPPVAPPAEQDLARVISRARATLAAAGITAHPRLDTTRITDTDHDATVTIDITWLLTTDDAPPREHRTRSTATAPSARHAITQAIIGAWATITGAGWR